MLRLGSTVSFRVLWFFLGSAASLLTLLLLTFIDAGFNDNNKGGGLVALQPPPIAFVTKEEGHHSNMSIVNGILMRVGTRPRDFVVIRGGSVTLEPIDVRLRKQHGKVVQRLRLLWPQLNHTLHYPQRRVWMDLGARFFPKGSTQWFIRSYPNSSAFEAVLFDVLDLADTYPPSVRAHFRSFEFLRKAAWVHDRGVEVKGIKMAHVKEPDKKDSLESVLNDTRAVWTIGSVDIDQYIVSRYSRDDFIVLKMDIEGGEWELLAHLIKAKSGVIGYIDELMLECHPRDVRASVDYMHQTCMDLINHMRSLGIACHRWV